jgi:GTP cyclohydrolase I
MGTDPADPRLPLRRDVPEERLREFERNVAEMFRAFGMEMDTPGTRETPRRFVRALHDSTSGYDGDPHLVKVFETECHGGPDCELSQIIEGPVPFFALCEHHALPFYGQTFVGYIAHEEIIGLSKLTRLVRLYARRFTVEERLGRQITEALETLLRPHGTAVYIAAHHLCTQMRGVRETAPETRMTFWRGKYETNAELRSEFLGICRGRR